MRDAESFAREWIAGWNARDLDAILAHYADDVIFSSPKAQEITGAPRVVGKTALAAYWRAALDRSPQLHFDLERVYAGANVVTTDYSDWATNCPEYKVTRLRRAHADIAASFSTRGPNPEEQCCAGSSA